MGLFDINNAIEKTLQYVQEETIVIPASSSGLNKDLKLYVGYSPAHKNSPRIKATDNSNCRFRVSDKNNYTEYKFKDQELDPINSYKIKSKETRNYIDKFANRYYQVLDYNSKHDQELNNKKLIEYIKKDLVDNNYKIPEYEQIYYNPNTKSFEIIKEE